MIEQIPAIVTPLENMSLDIIRTLGRRGIKVYGIDSDPNAPAKYSKYCHFVRCPDPYKDGGVPFLQFLIDFGKKLGSKAVIYPLKDHHVLLCSKERSNLEEYYEFVMPEEETLVSLATKDGLQNIAEKYNIPAPRTILINNNQQIESMIKDVNYPVILKPTESTYWQNPQIDHVLRSGLLAGNAKVILCNNPIELINSYHLIAAIDHRLVVQEVIPGEDSRLVYFSFYFNRQSKPLGIFAGRKHRIIPTGFGSASYVRSIKDPVLEEIVLPLLASINYRGLGGIEFKKDPRDNQYKLIEFNTRYGMWDGLGVKCGVDLAYIAYCDAINIPLDPVFSYRENIIWVDWQRDARAAIEYMRKGELTIGEWYHSFKGEKKWAVYSKEDWHPGVVYTITLAQKLLGRVISH